MPDNQTIIVNQSNRGCFSGCGTAFAVVLLIGIAVQYWYVSLAIVVVVTTAVLWHWRRERPAVGGPAAFQPAALGVAVPSSCPTCGAPATGNFCAECGTARTRICAGCGSRGLNSPYCPACGAATYVPPTAN